MRTVSWTERPFSKVSRRSFTRREIWRREFVNWPNRDVILRFSSKQALLHSEFSEHGFRTLALMD